jgi:hypothetical protein
VGGNRGVGDGDFSSIFALAFSIMLREDAKETGGLAVRSYWLPRCRRRLLKLGGLGKSAIPYRHACLDEGLGLRTAVGGGKDPVSYLAVSKR